MDDGGGKHKAISANFCTRRGSFIYLFARNGECFFFTIIASIMSIVNEVTFTSLVCGVIVGGVVDGLRYLRTHDSVQISHIIKTPKATAGVGEGSGDDERKFMVIFYFIMAAPILYTSFWLFASPSSSDFDGYFSIFSSLYDISYMLFPIVRRDVGSLIENGYQARVLITMHLYSVQHLSFFVFMLHGSISTIHRNSIIKSVCALENIILNGASIRQRPAQNPLIVHFVCLIIGVISYIIIELMVHIDYVRASRFWHCIHISNAPFIYCGVGLLFAGMCFLVSHASLMVCRMVVLRHELTY